ncbi:MAG: DUF4781 domain-containing protein, partial [Mycobacterium sp.]
MAQEKGTDTPSTTDPSGTHPVVGTPTPVSWDKTASLSAVPTPPDASNPTPGGIVFAANGVQRGANYGGSDPSAPQTGPRGLPNENTVTPNGFGSGNRGSPVANYADALTVAHDVNHVHVDGVPDAGAPVAAQRPQLTHADATVLANPLVRNYYDQPVSGVANSGGDPYAGQYNIQSAQQLEGHANEYGNVLSTAINAYDKPNASPANAAITGGHRLTQSEADATNLISQTTSGDGKNGTPVGSVYRAQSYLARGDLMALRAANDPRATQLGDAIFANDKGPNAHSAQTANRVSDTLAQVTNGTGALKGWNPASAGGADTGLGMISGTNLPRYDHYAGDFAGAVSSMTPDERANVAAKYANPTHAINAMTAGRAGTFQAGGKQEQAAIGKALGLTPDPANGTFTAEQLSAIQSVQNQIQKQGAQGGQVQAVPMLYQNPKGNIVAPTALFQVADASGRVHLIDDTGADYVGTNGTLPDALQNYANHNQLPQNGKLLMPKNGVVAATADGTLPMSAVAAHQNTTGQNVKGVVDKVAVPVTIAAGVAAEVGTLGLATPAVAAAGTAVAATGGLYFAGSAADHMYNDHLHGRPVDGSDVATLGMSALGLGAAGAAFKGATTAARALQGTALAVGTEQVGQGSVGLARQWGNLTTGEKVDGVFGVGGTAAMMFAPGATRRIGGALGARMAGRGPGASGSSSLGADAGPGVTAGPAGGSSLTGSAPGSAPSEAAASRTMPTTQKSDVNPGAGSEGQPNTASSGSTAPDAATAPVRVNDVGNADPATAANLNPESGQPNVVVGRGVGTTGAPAAEPAAPAAPDAAAKSVRSGNVGRGVNAFTGGRPGDGPPPPTQGSVPDAVAPAPSDAGVSGTDTSTSNVCAGSACLAALDRNGKPTTRENLPQGVQSGQSGQTVTDTMQRMFGRQAQTATKTQLESGLDGAPSGTHGVAWSEGTKPGEKAHMINWQVVANKINGGTR